MAVLAIAISAEVLVQTVNSEFDRIFCHRLPSCCFSLLLLSNYMEMCNRNHIEICRWRKSIRNESVFWKRWFEKCWLLVESNNWLCSLTIMAIAACCCTVWSCHAASTGTVQNFRQPCNESVTICLLTYCCCLKTFGDFALAGFYFGFRCDIFLSATFCRLALFWYLFLAGSRLVNFTTTSSPASSSSRVKKLCLFCWGTFWPV